jgi:hypothetical protein
MTAAKCGWYTLLTDKNAMILERLKETARLNHVMVSTHILQWGMILEDTWKPIHLVLSADCFYDPSCKFIFSVQNVS